MLGRFFARTSLALLLLSSCVIAAEGGKPQQQQSMAGNQASPPPQAMPSQEELKRQMKEEIKAKLKITKEQEDSYNKFMNSMLPSEAQMKKQESITKSLMSAKTTVERMEIQLTAIEEQKKQVSSNLEIVRAFYTQLSPEQKKAFDDLGRGDRPPHPQARKPK